MNTGAPSLARSASASRAWVISLGLGLLLSGLLPVPAWGQEPAASAAKATEEETGQDVEYARMVKAIFADDGIADIRVIFGYDNTKDFRDANDPGRAARFMKYLKAQGYEEHKPSEHAAAVLGVPVDAPNLRVLAGKNKQGRILRIALMWSSLSDSGARNIGVGYTDQLKRSEEAMNFMKKACAEAEVMMYVGHSRGGGGPDTYPPEIRPSKGSEMVTDFSYYRKNRPGMQALAPYLEKAEATPKLVAWTSCLSDVHFRKWFGDRCARKLHATGVVLSTRLTSYTPWKDEVMGYDEGVMVALAVIEALQYGRDGAQLREDLLGCEMEELRVAKPAWKLTMLPGLPLQPHPQPVAMPFATPAVAAGQ